MSRKGNPYDNAICESFMKTLKYEEVCRQEYLDLAEARAAIKRFLEVIYIQKRSIRPCATFRLPNSSSPWSRHVKTGLQKMRAPSDAFCQAWRNLSIRCGHL